MIIHPKIRGFICTTSHPLGCAKNVEEQIEYVKAKGKFTGPKKVLIIGASTGYGLASRIAATYGGGASTIGVFFEKPGDEKRTGSAGWYNTAAFESYAKRDGYYAKSINGDAFSIEVKEQTAQLIEKDLQQVDLVIYSLASPRRVHPNTNNVYSSVLKPINQTFTSKTVDPLRGEVKEITIDSATEEEIENTVAVMGGEDWQMWMDYLSERHLLAPGIKTVAYTYIGPTLTHPIYKNGTIGRAKDDLQKTADHLNQQLKGLHGEACLSVNKALVTQASSAIPVVPLYISILYKIMKEKGTHEGCIEQITRLFKDHLYNKEAKRDELNRIRLDDLEMQPDVQNQISQLWSKVTTENLQTLTDVQGYLEDFYHLFGFRFSGVNYDEDISAEVSIESLEYDYTKDQVS